MSLRFVCVLVILLGTVIDAIAQNRTNEKCGIQSSENVCPWLVGIEFKSISELIKRIQCTGALISKRHVVSNAKCFTSLYRGETKLVYLGSNITVIGGRCVGNGDESCSDDDSIRVPVEVVILHPEYNNTVLWSPTATSYYNIALVRLREMLPYTNFIRPICLPSVDVTQTPVPYLELYLTGISALFSNRKLYAPVTYLDRDNCQYNTLAEDEICATEADIRVRSPCLIMGGLVMNKRGDTYELIGPLILGSHCEPKRVFINLFNHLDWIRSNMSGWAPVADGCGRRKIDQIELIMNGEATKAGDWPWHVAIYRLQKSSITYICGGTLISKTMVLTAAHCATIGGVPVNPEILSVILGKFNLIGRDLQSQEIQIYTEANIYNIDDAIKVVHKNKEKAGQQQVENDKEYVNSIIVHEDFDQLGNLVNDIALLTLRNEVIYSDYIQPACIWSREASDRLPNDRDFGMVVGWGIDQSEQMSSQLKQAYIPRISELTCIKKNPIFYSKALQNNKKFCAGWANGTSPCNGDSGGGFLVFIPDIPKADSANAMGSWYVRGIVSMTVYDRNHGRCDPYHYVVFTNVENYIEWIQKNLKS